MRTPEVDQAMQLDRAFDEVLGVPNRGVPGPGKEEVEMVDAALVATLRTLCEAAARPVPAPHFVQRLHTELAGSDTAGLNARLIPFPTTPPSEDFAHAMREVTPLPNSFLRRDDDTLWRNDLGESSDGFAHDSLPISNPVPMGNRHQARRPTAPSPPWWRRQGIAALLLVIVALGGVSLFSSPGRDVPTPTLLSAITPLSEGAAPRVLTIYELGVDSLVEPSSPVGESTTPDENVWAMGWLDGQAIPMSEPNDPLAVSWLEGSAALGEGGNVVLQGHSAFEDSDTSVFADLRKLTARSLNPIQLTSVSNVTFNYAVTWVRRFPSHVSPDEQRVILGPTASESLTLITPTGTYDAKTGSFSEVIVVRAEHFSTNGLASIRIPDPMKCDVPPRPLAELDALALRFNNQPALRPTATSSESLAGAAADPATAAAITDTTRTLAACLNANDGLRSFALYSDEGLLRLFNFIFVTSNSADPSLELEWVPDFASLPELATPVPVNDQHVVWAVDDVRILDDGRVSAIVDIGPSQASQVPAMPTGEPTLYVFTREGERYVIDEVITPPL